MSEICASRTTAAGVVEVLVVWRPTWEPMEQVNSGAVWDAWMLDCAKEKSKEKTASAAKKSAAAAESDDDDDSDAGDSSKVTEDHENDGKQPTKKLAEVVLDVANEKGRRVHVKNVAKVVCLATAGSSADAAKEVEETETPKRGRGRPPKNAAGGESTKKK